MKQLTMRDRELVAIGAALGSNCIPCIESHIPKARKAGLSDSEIREAVRMADELRQVPAAKVLQAALTGISGTSEESAEGGALAEQATAPCCGGSPAGSLT